MLWSLNTFAPSSTRRSPKMLPSWFQGIMHSIQSSTMTVTWYRVHTHTCCSAGVYCGHGEGKKDWKLMQLTCYNLQSSLKIACTLARRVCVCAQSHLETKDTTVGIAWSERWLCIGFTPNMTVIIITLSLKFANCRQYHSKYETNNCDKCDERTMKSVYTTSHELKTNFPPDDVFIDVFIVHTFFSCDY